VGGWEAAGESSSAKANVARIGVRFGNKFARLVGDESADPRNDPSDQQYSRPSLEREMLSQKRRAINARYEHGAVYT
jgi:hypothetical protein